MNAARSIDPPATPADAAAHAAASLSRHTPAANTDALHGWMAACDASACAGEMNLYAIALAISIQRALEAGDISTARSLASLQQYAFDNHHGSVEKQTAEYTQRFDALKAGLA